MHWVGGKYLSGVNWNSVSLSSPKWAQFVCVCMHILLSAVISQLQPHIYGTSCCCSLGNVTFFFSFDQKSLWNHCSHKIDLQVTCLNPRIDEQGTFNHHKHYMRTQYNLLWQNVEMHFYFMSNINPFKMFINLQLQSTKSSK